VYGNIQAQNNAPAATSRHQAVSGAVQGQVRCASHHAAAHGISNEYQPCASTLAPQHRCWMLLWGQGKGDGAQIQARAGQGGSWH
jgi:hypothetical protein